MTESEIRPIVSNIARGYIYEALRDLGRMQLTGTRADKLREADMVYRQMLRYHTMGQPDPTVNDNLHIVREMLYGITDSLLRDVRAERSQELYYSRLRVRRMPGQSGLSELLSHARNKGGMVALADEAGEYRVELHREFEDAVNQLFDAIWVNISLSKNEAAEIQQYVVGTDIGDEAAMLLSELMLSALTLSAMQYYDARKLEILLAVYARSGSNALRARALVGATLVIAQHPERSRAGSAIRALCAECADHEKFGADIKALATCMLMTRDTDRVNRKMSTEIIPDLMKLKPEIEKRIKSIDPDMAGSLEEAPEWMELIEKSGVGDKLRELSEMQMEGADVFMGAFARMKSYVFFRDVSAWFTPYSERNSHVHNIIEEQSTLVRMLLTQMPMFCSSDKYSFVLSLAQMPTMQMRLMTEHLNSSLGEMNTEMMEAVTGKYAGELSVEISMYLKDLYRFFRVFERREGIPDPFASPFRLPEHPLYASMSDNLQMLRMIADFNFKYGYWQDAAPIYGRLAEESDEYTDYQKLGYCLEKSGDVAGALKAYNCSELLSDPDKWLLKRMAWCLRSEGRYAEAAGYYGRVLAKEPDNLRIEMLRGHSLLEAGEPLEALKCYYKVDYLDPESGRASRAIAWCEFLAGNYSKSIKRYESITSAEGAAPTDWLNFGHALQASGDKERAVNTYRQMVKATDADTFRKQYEADRQTLENAGISPIDVQLMADAVLIL